MLYNNFSVFQMLTYIFMITCDTWSNPKCMVSFWRRKVFEGTRKFLQNIWLFLANFSSMRCYVVILVTRKGLEWLVVAGAKLMCDLSFIEIFIIHMLSHYHVFFLHIILWCCFVCRLRIRSWIRVLQKLPSTLLLLK